MRDQAEEYEKEREREREMYCHWAASRSIIWADKCTRTKPYSGLAVSIGWPQYYGKCRGFHLMTNTVYVCPVIIMLS